MGLLLGANQSVRSCAGPRGAPLRAFLVGSFIQVVFLECFESLKALMMKTQGIEDRKATRLLRSVQPFGCWFKFGALTQLAHPAGLYVHSHDFDSLREEAMTESLDLNDFVHHQDHVSKPRGAQHIRRVACASAL